MQDFFVWCVNKMLGGPFVDRGDKSLLFGETFKVKGNYPKIYTQITKTMKISWENFREIPNYLGEVSLLHGCKQKYIYISTERL